MAKFEFGVRVREWILSSPVFKVAARRGIKAQVREKDARGREIHVQRRRNDAGRRETKKPTNGELLGYRATILKCILKRGTLTLNNLSTKYYGEISTISVSESNIFLKPL